MNGPWATTGSWVGSPAYEEYSDSLLATPDLKDAVPSLLGLIQPTHLGGLEKPCVRSNQDRALEDV